MSFVVWVGLALADTGGETTACLGAGEGTLRDWYCYFEVDWNLEPTYGPFKCAAGSDFGWVDYGFYSDGAEIVDTYDHQGVNVGDWSALMGGGCLCEGTVVYDIIYNDLEGSCIAPMRVWEEPPPEEGGCPGGSAALLFFGGALFWRRR